MRQKSPEKVQTNDDAGLMDKAVNAYVHKNWNEIYKIALRIALIHLIIGAAWIILSDKLLDLFTNDKDLITFLSIIKGWVYVVVMSVILYTAIYSLIKAVRRVENDLVDNHIKVNEANTELELLNEQLSISQKKFLELNKQLDYSEKRHRFFVETTNDAIWEETNGARWFSERWHEITGYSSKDMQEMELESLIHPSDREKVKRIITDHVMSNTPYYDCEYRIITKTGEYKWIKAKGRVATDNNESYRILAIHMDMSELNECKEKLQYIAYHDQLTGLQNRLALHKKMYYLMNDKHVNRFALLYIDIDKFKNINDTMGHSFGDNLLQQISERLKLQNNIDALFRIGDDEFIVLIKQFDKRDDIERSAINIIKTLKTPFIIEANNIFITASIGVSLYPEHGIDTDTLLKNADIAVYKAKESGRNRIVFYNEPMNEIIIERMYIENNLWSALVNNEFELYYQPQYDLESDCISGFEALIRWNSVELGMISPDRFIGIAEDTHLIIPIGVWVLKTACAYLKKLHQLGYQNLNISVNISILQLLQDEFVDMVMDTITTEGIKAKHLELEITESILMESYETIAGKLRLLRAKGIRIALDDFGKGYSSLTYLKLLPSTTLKIDKVFIDTITDSERNKTFVDLIVNLGKSLKLCVIAEGVETTEQKDYLVKHRCDKMQGYLFSKPLSEYEVIQNMNGLWDKNFYNYKGGK